MNIERYRTITLGILIVAFTVIYFFAKFYYSNKEIEYVERKIIEEEVKTSIPNNEEINLFDPASEKYQCIEGSNYYVKGSVKEGQIGLPSYGQIRKDGGAIYNNGLLIGEFEYLTQKTELFIMDLSKEYSDMLYDKLSKGQEKITKTNIVLIVQEEVEKNYIMAKDMFIEDLFINSEKGNNKIYYHAIGCDYIEEKNKYLPRFIFTYKNKNNKIVTLGEKVLNKEKRKENLFEWSKNEKYFFNEIDSTVINTKSGKNILQSINTLAHGKWTKNNVLYVRGAGKYDDNIYKFDPISNELKEVFYLEGEQISFSKLEETDLITTAFSIDEESNIIKASFFRIIGNVNYEIKIEMDLEGSIISKTKREYL